MSQEEKREQEEKTEQIEGTLPPTPSWEREEESSQPKETSLLFERHAIWVVLALLLLSIWYQFIPLIFVSLLLLLLSILVWGWKHKALHHLKPSLHLSRNRLFAGEKFIINASLHNDKWLPLVWLEWEFPKYEGVVYGEENRGTTLIRFLWILWFQTVKWSIKAQALERGVYNVGQITLRSGDGFRLAETEQKYRLDGELFVYPKLIPVIVPSFHLSIQWGIRGKQGGFLEDPLLISGIREYQPGDEWRKLNWRASARTGKLQTNIYQPVVIKQLFFYVDVQHFMLNETAYDDPIKQKAYRVKQKEAFERFLSIIASVAMRYKEQGVSLGLATNALNHMGQKMSHTACQPNITPFLDQLAQMTPRVGLKGMDVLDRLMVQRKLSLPFFIFCGQVTKAHHTWYEKHKDQIDHIQFFYMENSEHAQQLRETAKAIDSLLA